MPKNKLNIVLCFDSNVIVGALTLIVSIIKNNPDLDCRFHLFAINQDLENLKKFLDLYSSIFEKLNIRLYDIAEFEEYKTQKENLDRFLKKGNRNLTVAAFYRIIIANNIQLDDDRFLYLDTDVVCNGDISTLASIEFNNHIVAAVPDFDHQLDYARKILNFTGDNYFNSGVLLVNISEWKKESVSKQCIDYLLDKFPKQLDQDALNLICTNRVLWLAKEYNTITNNGYDLTNPNAVLIHYTGADKPWKPWYDRTRVSYGVYQKYLLSLEKSEEKWFDFSGEVSNPLSIPSSIHDYKMVSKIYKKNHQYVKAFEWLMKHFRLKFKRKGLFNILLLK